MVWKILFHLVLFSELNLAATHMRKIFSLSLAVFALATSSHQLIGQAYKNTWSDYMEPLRIKSDSIIKTGNVLTAADVERILEADDFGLASVELKKENSKSITTEELYECVAAATVIVSSAGKCDHCNNIHTNPASGYLIGADGICVTNYHVLETYCDPRSSIEGMAIVAMMQDGKAYAVTEILSASKSDDVAVLRLETNGDKLPTLPLTTNDPKIGSPAYVVSHPKGWFYAFSAGVVTDKFVEPFRIKGDNHVNRNVLAISADYAAGSSGAPVIDQYGNVISTVSYTRTLVYPGSEDKQTQMVIKGTIPSSSLLKLISEKS